MAKLYNLEYLEEISGGDKDFIADMLNDFVNNSPVSLSEIEKAVEDQNWSEVYAVVHRFIPTFEFVGAEEIRSRLRIVETNAKTLQQLDLIPGLIAEIKLSLVELIRSIKNDLKF
jgi:HPt (histidine-containing phosphotransfer) domain-containing protein